MSHTTTKIVIARQDGSVLGQYVLGAGEHLIGREIDAAIYIDDPSVSRAHARLFISGDIVEIEDLQSTSGTYVDGVAVRGRIPLEPSQKVHISDLYIDIVREGFRELVAGARLTQGRFTLVRLLGQGGMGAVWLALDETQGQQVALKLLPPEMAHDTSGLQDLEREVAKTARFQHANILKIEGLITTEGEPPFILMEYVEGINLHEVRGQNPDRLMIWSGVRHYMLQLCEALEYAHNQKVAHRDLKPSNLLINPQAELKLADFGIAASIAGTASTLTMGVLEAGTPSYMGPQQVEGRLPQATDDIYALGATFYDLLTSKPPFYQGDIVHQVLNIPATPIKERLKELNLQNEVPDYVSAMVMACLHKDPAQRPPTVNAVKKWIETEGKADFVAVKQVAWEETPMPTQAGVAPVAPQAAPKVKGDWIPAAQRKKVLAYGAVAAVIVILIGTATWWTSRPKEVNDVSAVVQKQLEEGLVAYFKFDGDTEDATGNGHQGKNLSGASVTTDRHGNSAGSYNFDGVDDVINIGNADDLALSEFTISVWFKWRSNHPSHIYRTLLAKGEGIYLTHMNYMLQVANSNKKGGGYLNAVVGKGEGPPDDSSNTVFSSREDVTDGGWHHALLSFSSKSGVGSLYLDGQLKDTKKDLSPAFTNKDQDATIGIWGGVNYGIWAGLLDDIRIYNRALSTEEITALYDLEKPKSGSEQSSVDPAKLLSQLDSNSNDPLVKAYIETNGDLVEAIRKTTKYQNLVEFDSQGRLTRVPLNDIPSLTDEALGLLIATPSIKKLEIAGTKISDKGLLNLINLRNLEFLHIAICPNITDEGFKHLAKIPKLKTIMAYDNIRISNQGLGYLSASKTLEGLDVARCGKINGVGLNYLLRLPNPPSITVEGTGVTSAQAEEFMRKKPGSQVNY